VLLFPDIIPIPVPGPKRTLFDAIVRDDPAALPIIVLLAPVVRDDPVVLPINVLFNPLAIPTLPAFAPNIVEYKLPPVPTFTPCIKASAAVDKAPFVALLKGPYIT
jgi:hypothetical protein